MKLIVVEGLDGAGKSTQIQMLLEHFESKGYNSRFLHFPRMNEPFFGELISKFLRGEFGKLKDVDPYLVAMMYAGDRNDASPAISDWLKKGYYVLLDRYVYSNIAYQCAKLDKPAERDRLKDWILRLEFEHFNIPVPALNIFLDVPFSFTKSKLKENRSGDDRKYLNGSSDIHEESLRFQEEVRKVYIEAAKSDRALEILDCSDKAGNIMSPPGIFDGIIKLLLKKEILI